MNKHKIKVDGQEYTRNSKNNVYEYVIIGSWQPEEPRRPLRWSQTEQAAHKAVAGFEKSDYFVSVQQVNTDEMQNGTLPRPKLTHQPTQAEIDEQVQVLAQAEKTSHDYYKNRCCKCGARSVWLKSQKLQDQAQAESHKLNLMKYAQTIPAGGLA